MTQKQRDAAVKALIAAVVASELAGVLYLPCAWTVAGLILSGLALAVAVTRHRNRPLPGHQEMSFNCHHADGGMCVECQADHDEDPTAYAEYGPHAEGDRRWAAVMAEWHAYATSRPVAEPDENLPF